MGLPSHQGCIWCCLVIQFLIEGFFLSYPKVGYTFVHLVKKGCHRRQTQIQVLEHSNKVHYYPLTRLVLLQFLFHFNSFNTKAMQEHCWVRSRHVTEKLRLEESSCSLALFIHLVDSQPGCFSRNFSVQHARVILLTCRGGETCLFTENEWGLYPRCRCRFAT